MRNNNNLQQQFNNYLTWCEINNLQVKYAKSLIEYVKQEEWLKLREEEN